MKKLSPAQVRVLRALAGPGAAAHFCQNRSQVWGPFSKKRLGPGWLLPHLGLAEINTIRVLASNELVFERGNNELVITDKGRSYLASLEKIDER